MRRSIPLRSSTASFCGNPDLRSCAEMDCCHESVVHLDYYPHKSDGNCAECSEEYLVLLSVDFRQYLLADFRSLAEPLQPGSAGLRSAGVCRLGDTGVEKEKPRSKLTGASAVEIKGRIGTFPFSHLWQSGDFPSCSFRGGSLRRAYWQVSFQPAAPRGLLPEPLKSARWR